jgi:hypothetical protein
VMPMESGSEDPGFQSLSGSKDSGNYCSDIVDRYS